MSESSTQDGAAPYGYAPGGKDTGVVKSKGKPTLHLAEGSEGIPIRVLEIRSQLLGLSHE